MKNLLYLILLLLLSACGSELFKLRGPQNATYMFQYREISDATNSVRIGYSDDLYLPGDTVEQNIVIIGVKRRNDKTWIFKPE